MSETIGSSTIDDYDLLNFIGKGGSGEVYKAKEKKSSNIVAIKMISKTKIRSLNTHKRIRQEVEIHHRLKHPSIVELYGFFEDSSYVYLVQELCCGGDFYSYLKKAQQLSLTEIKHFFFQIVQGLSYLHKHGIIHRDLTWSNILLCSDKKTVKISDFGISTRLTEPDQMHKTFCGTPEFISPEIASNKNHGLSSDIWSLGCILYTLFLRHPPFKSKNMQETMMRAINEEISIPKHIPVDAADLIKLLLNKNPQKRPDINDILKHKFFSAKTTLSSTDSGIYFSTESNTRSKCTINPKLSLPTLKSVPETYSDQKKDTSFSKNQNTTMNSKKDFQPLNSIRLGEYTYAKNDVSLQIKPNSWIKVDKMKNIEANKLNFGDIIEISPDGLQIFASQESANSENIYYVKYSFDNMPKILWKNYKFASKFTKLLRTKTQKITWFNPGCKVLLMESGDFYYTTKSIMIIIYANSERCKLYQNGKLSLIFTYINSPSDDPCYKHFKNDILTSKTLYEQILIVEKQLEDLNLESIFPALIGKIDDLSTSKKTLTVTKESIHLPQFLQEKFQNSSNFDKEFENENKVKSWKYIHDIGWVVASQNEMSVHFTDNNSILTILNETIEYKDSTGRLIDHNDPIVQKKIKTLPSILKKYNQLCLSNSFNNK